MQLTRLPLPSQRDWEDSYGNQKGNEEVIRKEGHRPQFFGEEDRYEEERKQEELLKQGSEQKRIGEKILCEEVSGEKVLKEIELRAQVQSIGQQERRARDARDEAGQAEERAQRKDG